METQNIFARNRVILTHFDSYSTAMLVPAENRTPLWPKDLQVASSNLSAKCVAAMSERVLLREVFNLIVGGGVVESDACHCV